MTYRGGGWREVQEEGVICTCTADSLHCTAENNDIIKQLYANKIFLKIGYLE